MFKEILAAFILIIALGVSVAAYNVSNAVASNWDRATTASAVMGLTTVCGGGLLVLALMIAIIFGLPFAVRLFFEAGVARKSFDSAPTITYRTSIPAPRAGEQPMLIDGKAGSWQSTGTAGVSTWEDDAMVAMPVERWQGGK
jgi:hypothetical protein